MSKKYELTFPGINTLDNYGFAPIHYAVLKNDEKYLEKLLNDPELNLYLQDARGITAIRHAIILERKNLIDILSKDRRYRHEMDLDENGFTELHYAVLTNNYKKAKDLYEMRASPYTKDKYGISCMEYAIKYSFKEIIDLFSTRFDKYIYKADPIVIPRKNQILQYFSNTEVESETDSSSDDSEQQPFKKYNIPEMPDFLKKKMRERLGPDAEIPCVLKKKKSLLKNKTVSETDIPVFLKKKISLYDKKPLVTPVNDSDKQEYSIFNVRH